MYSHRDPIWSGQYSIRDARERAVGLLVYGPRSPGPRRRLHRGMLPDVPDTDPGSGRSQPFAWLKAFFGRSAEVVRTDVPAPKPAAAVAESTADDLCPAAHETNHMDRLAA